MRSVRRFVGPVLGLALLASACTGTDTADTGLFDPAQASTETHTDSGASVALPPAYEAEHLEEAAEDSMGDWSADDAGDAAVDTAAVAPAFGNQAEVAPRDSYRADAEVSADSGIDREGLFVRPEIEPESVEPEPAFDRSPDGRFTHYGYRRFVAADEDPLSTFALDVDTGSYTITRRWLQDGIVPPPEAVRVEEFVNAFDYDYDVPRDGLEVTVDGGPSPFDEGNILVRVGVNAEEIPERERPPVALTFIVDTSGSMNGPDRLGLVKDSLAMLVDGLHRDDTVAIVVYSDDSGVVLAPTRVSDRDKIIDAIDGLRTGGSTNLESGLREGYSLAAEAFRRDGVNRVIIASDGVANAGITDHDELAAIIRGYADDGIQLVTVGYGMGNFNDTMMEQLADNGDGFYAYVDSHDEAERFFDYELVSTLITAAIDAKIQVEFDPEIVEEYRLIGFENRAVQDSDFRNDRVDAGELGAGHQVTAMYEIDLARGVSLNDRDKIGEVFLRWQDPDTGAVIEIDRDIDLRDIEPQWHRAPTDFQLATVVTALAEVLRDNPYADDIDLDAIATEAERVAGQLDREPVRELVELAHQAALISRRR